MLPIFMQTYIYTKYMLYLHNVRISRLMLIEIEFIEFLPIAKQNAKQNAKQKRKAKGDQKLEQKQNGGKFEQSKLEMTAKGLVQSKCKQTKRKVVTGGA